MLLFCHMFIGAVLGLLLLQWTGKRWAVPVLAFGAILPDLIDKPLGHFILASTLDYGRIYAHSLLFLALLSLIAVAAWRFRSSQLVAVVALGVSTHLILDSMWEIPVSLLWPLLGPFQPHHSPDYVASSILMEVTSPLEWLFGLMLVSILLMLYRDKLGAFGQKVARGLEPLQLPILAFMVVGGLLAAATGVLTAPVDWVSGQQDIIAGSCALLGGAFLLRRELRRIGYTISNS